MCLYWVVSKAAQIKPEFSIYTVSLIEETLCFLGNLCVIHVKIDMYILEYDGIISWYKVKFFILIFLKGKLSNFINSLDVSLSKAW